MIYNVVEDLLVTGIISLSFIIAGLFLFTRKAFNNQESVFGYFIVLNVIFELIAWTSTALLENKNNLPGLHLYTLLEFILITKFAVASIDKLQGLPARIILIAGSLLIIINSIWFQSIYTYNSITVTAVKIITITFSIIFFYKLLSSKKYSIIQTRPSVYFFTAIFLNACTSMIWYMYSNKIILLDRVMYHQLNIVKHSASIIAYLIILTGIFYILKRKENDII